MFNPNGYDIKGVKYLPTHDGVAFTGTLYKDGKRIGSVENGGTGGPNCAHFDTREGGTAFRAWVATLGTHTYPAQNGRPELTVPFDEETAIECLLQIDDAPRGAGLRPASPEGHRLPRGGRRTRSVPQREVRVHPDAHPRPGRLPGQCPWWSRVTEVWHIGEGWKLERATPQD